MLTVNQLAETAMWQRNVQRWCNEWVSVIAEHRGPGRFGEAAYWKNTYRQQRGPDEWFVTAQVAARGAQRAFRPERRIRVLHLGCGRSTLGAAIAEVFDVDVVVNADCSADALKQLEQRTKEEHAATAHAQRYELWDARDDWQGGRFDLVLDKGALDAFQFAGSDLVVKYCATLRACTSCVYLHWSDDPPEMKTGLLRAAFPEDDGWTVACVEEETNDAWWTYYRYSVLRRD